MFTGIIEAIGKVESMEPWSGPQGEQTSAQNAAELGKSIWITLPWRDVILGESIAVNGVCLTIADLRPKEARLDISHETLSCTNLGSLEADDRVNLERALCLGDRLSGHLVQGHVDGVAKITEITQAGESTRLQVELPDSAAARCIHKGSITLDGVSLTINQIQDNQIEINLVPHTWEHTCFKYNRPGDSINYEIDLFAKYAEKLCHSPN